MGKFDLKSWLNGFVLGLAGNPLPTTAPVAYLYNGARLPALPEEITKYQCAAIIYTANNAADGKPFAQLFLMDVPCVLAGSILSGYQLTGKVVWYEWIADESTIEWSGLLGLPDGIVANKWVHKSTKSGENVVVFRSTPTWANFDVLKYDGTVILEASEPVPVYE